MARDRTDTNENWITDLIRSICQKKGRNHSKDNKCGRQEVIQHIDIWCPEEDNLTNEAGNVQEKKRYKKISPIWK